MPRSTPPTSIEHGRFDTTALQSELAMALEEDRKYKLTDSMKKRAIHTAANYDEFKNLVACADLKPISQRELQSFSNADRSHNLSYKKPSTRKSYGNNLQFNKPASIDSPPKTAVDFSRQWRRNLKTNASKYKYLQLTTPETLASIFKSDIDAELLIDIVRVLKSSLQPDGDDREAQNQSDRVMLAVATLSALSKTSRFALIIDFFDNSEMEQVRELFQLLEPEEMEKDKQTELELLKTVYKAG